MSSAQSESARDEHGGPEGAEGPEGPDVNGSDAGPADAVQESRQAPRQPPRRDSRGGRKRSWVTVGFALGLGASLAWLAVQTVLRVSSMLTLILLAVFIAISLEPLVVRFTRRGLRRGWAVAIVLTGFVVVLAGFLALVIPPVAKEIGALVTVLAVLVGGALLGIIGALVAIPAAVAAGLILDEYVFPEKERK
ncbi:AI-2E family transporter [Streptomyces prunicolor]|uniref:AI-2E family transporter n=1 Tax=Streptomyces prunicolor TaxID=67348 RepID=UPI00341DEEA1